MSTLHEPLRQISLVPSEGPSINAPFRNAIVRRLDEDTKVRYRIAFLHKPGVMLSDDRLGPFVRELRSVAAECFDDMPDYQCLTGSREELADKVITVAWRPDGRMAGFCSAVILPVAGVGNVLHLGLTCVRPDDRGGGLTHKLTSALVLQYLLRHKPFGKQWFTNLACVLSSLGNVALHFEEIYPSPLNAKPPSRMHRLIAQAVDRQYRDKMFIAPEAKLDPDAFVFRESVKGTVFQKRADDRRFHHRNVRLNQFYTSIMRFDEGDETLQVGWASLLNFPVYYMKRMLVPPPGH